MAHTSKKMSFRRLAAASATALFAMGTLAACGGDTSNDAAANGEGEELTQMSVIVAPIHFEPAYIADRMGFFEDHGLDVDVRPGADAQANFAQALSGDVDIVTTSWTVMVTSNSEGVPVKTVAGNGYLAPDAQGSGVFVKPDSGIDSIADLEGKTLGVQGVRSGSDLAVLLAAEDEGIDPESITQVAIPFSGMQAALESGQVDAVMAVDPFASQIESAGMENLGNMQAKYTPNVNSTVWAATDEWLAENSELAEKFVAAMEDAVEYYDDPANLDEVRGITAEISQTDIEKVRKDLPAIKMSITEEAASDNLADLNRLGYITKEVTFEDAVWEGAPLD